MVGLGVLSPDTHDPTLNNGSDQVSVALDLSNLLPPIPQGFLYLVTIVSLAPIAGGPTNVFPNALSPFRGKCSTCGDRTL